LVLRAFCRLSATNRQDTWQELPGSPLRLDGERYAELRELCHLGLGRRARLVGLQGHQLRGWASGASPLGQRWAGPGGEPPAPAVAPARGRR
jgi:hypothetical protein